MADDLEVMRCWAAGVDKWRNMSRWWQFAI